VNQSPGTTEDPTLEAVDVVHATSPEGYAACSGVVSLDRIDLEAWRQVPPEQRCPTCDQIMSAWQAGRDRQRRR
jgi:hypothetical protein